MNATPEQERPLLDQIGEVQERLGEFERDLSEIEGELQSLEMQREQYHALGQACNSIEHLREIGAARLLWGDEIADALAEEHVERARRRIDEYRERIRSVADARRNAAQRLTEGRGVLSILEDDWQELQEREEERANEWVIEREMDPPVERPVKMPWTRGGEEDQRFRKSLGSSLAVALLFGLLMPLIHLPLPEPSAMIEVPERLVELIRRDREPPPAPPAVAEEVQPEPVEPEEAKTEPEPEPERPQAVAEQSVEAPPLPPAEEAPKQKARSSGILAFSDSIASIAASRPSVRLGSDARINNTGDASIGRPERSMITTQAPGSSGGINLAALSRDVGDGNGGGGAQMAGVATTRVASSIGPGGNGDRPYAGAGGIAGRTDEEIQIVFDRYKASLYRLYNRELRKSPTLRGQMVLLLTIEPDGTVSMCDLQSSDMNAPELVQQVLERVRTFDFGAKDVAAITIVYPIDFLPAA
jgi:outer membrane biosynthesis protein TonB